MIPAAVSVVFEILLFASMVLCLARMAVGPSAADRMVAIDLLGLLVAVLMISHAIHNGDESILDRDAGFLGDRLFRHGGAGHVFGVSEGGGGDRVSFHHSARRRAFAGEIGERQGEGGVDGRHHRSAPERRRSMSRPPDQSNDWNKGAKRLRESMPSLAKTFLR